MRQEKQVKYEKIVKISNDFFEKIFLKKIKEKNNIFLKKEQFFAIVVKLFNLKEYNTISFSKEEVKFLLEYDIYTHLKEIIEELEKV